MAQFPLLFWILSIYSTHLNPLNSIGNVICATVKWHGIFHVVWWHGHPTIACCDHGTWGHWPRSSPMNGRPMIHPYSWEGAWLGGKNLDGPNHLWDLRLPILASIDDKQYALSWFTCGICRWSKSFGNGMDTTAWGPLKCWQRSYIEPKFDPHPCSWKPPICIYIYN